MPSPSLTELLHVAIDAAHLGGRRTLAYFNAGVAVETKADDTPVTRADREAEEVIRSVIARHYPDHAILGEEGGDTAGRDPDHRWIIDPIDGTKSFIHGVPLYGVLVGVEVRQRPSVGVIYLPALDELVHAATGHGCWWNGRPARVSPTAALSDALLTTTSPESARARSGAYERLVSACKITRAWGDCYGYALVATGRADVMLDPKMNPWDCAPMVPILTEAGGHFRNWDGEETIWGKDAVATNGALIGPVLEVLRGKSQ